MKRIFAILSAIVLFASHAKAGFVLEGTLYGDGEPLINAYIYVPELQRGVITDSDGRYSVVFDKTGGYTLDMSYVGFEPLQETVNIKRERQRKNFYLQQSGRDLDEIVVTGESGLQRLQAPTLGREKLTIGQIRKLPSFMGEVDVIKSMQMLPGVQSTSEGSSSFSVRGGAPDQNLILLDGATIYNASHLMGFFSVFNNDIIENATLYKGDIPATQGGRLSSLLEIETKEGNNEKFSGSGGIGLISSRLLLEGPIVKDRLNAWIAGRVFYAGLFLPLMDNPALASTRLTFFDINAKLSATLNDKNRLFFSGYIGEDYFALSGTGEFDYANKAASLRWSCIVNPEFYINTTATASWYDYDAGGALSGLSAQWRASIADYGLRQEYSWDIDKHNHLKFGFSTSYKQMHTGDVSMTNVGIDTELGINLPVNHSLESALFVSNEQTYGQVSLNYGLRVSMFNNIAPQTELILDEHHEAADSVRYESGIYNTYFEFEPRFGISWMFYDNMSLKAGYSRTAQYLHLIQTTTAGSPLDVWRPSNTNIKPTVCNQFSAGYFWNFYKDMFSFSVEGYYKILQDVVDFKDFANVMLNKNIDAEIVSGKGRSYGVELMLRKDAGNLTGWISYTYSRAFQTIEGINDGNEYSASTDRPHSVNLVLNYKINKWIDVGANWVYATGQPMTAPESKLDFDDFGESEIIPLYSGRNKYRMPDYHRLDLSITFDLNKGVKKRFNHNLNISVYNVYCRHNAWMIQFETDPELGAQVANMTYLFSIVPSVTYNFSF